MLFSSKSTGEKVGLVQAEIWQIAQTMIGPAVLLQPHESDRVIPIYIGMQEARAILFGLSDEEPERPMTHDLMAKVFTELDIHVSHIAVTDIKDKTFFAELHCDHDGREFSIDARPSDCMAVAVRVKCPIYVDDDVVGSASVPIADLNITSADRGGLERSDGEDSVLDELQQALQVAVDEEDYEEAASLRDRIKELEGGT